MKLVIEVDKMTGNEYSSEEFKAIIGSALSPAYKITDIRIEKDTDAFGVQNIANSIVGDVNNKSGLYDATFLAELAKLMERHSVDKVDVCWKHFW